MKKREISGASRIYKINQLTIDLDRQRLRRRGSAWQTLSGLNCRLLEVLIEFSPEPASRRKLIDRVWDDVSVAPATLTQRVRLLRQELGSPEYVRLVKGVGYKLGFEPFPATRRQVHMLFKGRLLATLSVITAFAVALLSSNHVVQHWIRHFPFK